MSSEAFSPTSKIVGWTMLAYSGGTTVINSSITDTVTIPQWKFEVAITSPKSIPHTFKMDAFQVAPNKVSPQDKVWQEVEQFLIDWDTSGATTDMSDDWLDELRAGWDARLDEIYGLEDRE